MTGAARQALLDTSVVVDYPAARVAEVADELAVSAITVAELHYGVTATDDPLEKLARRRRLKLVLDTYEVIPFDTDVAEYYGALATLVRQAGRNPRPRRMDLQIAATAAGYDVRLLTRNGADFTGLESAVDVVEL